MPQSTICRLCVNGCSDSKTLYNARGCPNDLCEMVFEYFHPKIIDKEEAKHLTVICLECFGHIYDFHNFQTSVIMAQLKLIEEHAEVPVKTEKEEATLVAVPITEAIPDEIVNNVETESEESAAVQVSGLMGDKNEELLRCSSEIIQLSSDDDGVAEIENEPDDIETRKSSKELQHSTVGLDSEVLLDDDVSQGQRIHDSKDVSATNHSTNTTKASNDSDLKDDVGPPLATNDSLHNDTKKRFQCHLCRQSYVFKKMLKLHITRKHMESRKIVNRRSNRSLGATHLDTEISKASNANRQTFSRNQASMSVDNNKSQPDEGSEDNIDSESHISSVTKQKNFKLSESQTVKVSTEVLSEGSVTPSTVVSTQSNAKSKCIICKRFFPNDKALRNHIRQRHNISGELSPADINALCENAFKCTICKTSFSSLFLMSKHLKMLHPGIVPSMLEDDYDPTTKRYNCKFCTNYFARKCDLVCHMHTWHKNNSGNSSIPGGNDNEPKKPFRCNYCICSYTIPSSLQSHMIQQHPEKYYSRKTDFDFDYDETTKRSICKLCGNSYATKRHFVKHMEIRHPEARKQGASSSGNVDNEIPNEAFKCHLCNMAFKLEYNLKKHMASRHGKKAPPVLKFDFDYDETTKLYKCKSCYRTYARKAALSRHTEAQHSEERKFMKKVYCYYQYDDVTKMFNCKLCECSYKSKTTLIHHLAREHGKTLKTKYGCKKCEKYYLSKDALTEHYNQAHQATTAAYSCNQCGKTFNQYWRMHYHRRVIHGWEHKHKCQICDRGFRAHFRLQEHLATQHPDSTQLPEKLAANSTSTNLDGEKNNGDRTAVSTCNDCGKSYKDHLSLDRHRCRNASRPKHKCAICAKMFKTSTALGLHHAAHLRKDKKRDNGGGSATGSEIHQKTPLPIKGTKGKKQQIKK